MNQNDVIHFFTETLREDPNKSEALAAIQTLVEFIKFDNAETLLGFRKNLKQAIEYLMISDHGSRVTSISSGCDLFLRFITLTLVTLEDKNYQECKTVMVKRGELFLDKLASCRKKISRLANPFINDGATILVHSRSRVVFHALKDAMDAKTRFTVYVTESLPDHSGHRMANDLKEIGIPVVVILDAAVGYIMEKIDFVLVGAEGVAESGGIINKIGTFTISVCAKEMNKPVYVMAESFKFIRVYPLNQQDVPDHFKYTPSKLTDGADLSAEHPMVDYTPPSSITLLFTDLGVLTPSGVSDELIKLYL